MNWTQGDTPYSYGAVFDKESNQQVLYFDLPRISVLQFNIFLGGITARGQPVEKIKAAINRRLEVDWHLWV